MKAATRDGVQNKHTSRLRCAANGGPGTGEQVTTDTQERKKYQKKMLLNRAGGGGSNASWACCGVWMCMRVRQRATQLPGGVVHGSPAEGSSK